jgi:hypothetical protein
MSQPVSHASLRAALLDLLHRPARLSLVLYVVLAAVWYVAAYLPLRGGVDQAARRVAAERERLALAREVSHLRHEVERFQGHLPAPGDGNAWVHFLMGGVRQFPLRLVSLEPRPAVEVGPYQGVVFRVIVEGAYPDLGRFLRWLEGGPRLVRVEALQVAAQDGQGAGQAATSQMQVLVMGVDG